MSDSAAREGAIHQPEPGDPWHGCNPLDPDFRDDPHPRFSHLRATEPVFHTPFGMWWLTRHEDCVELLKKLPSGVRTTDGRLPGVDESLPGRNRLFMLQQDPPTHTRLRRLVSRAFTPRAVAKLEPAISRVVDQQLDAVMDRGEMDVIADLALPVPATMICEMMGVPTADRDRFTAWTTQATHLLAEGIAPAPVIEMATAAANELAEYFDELIAERRKARRDDILSALIAAQEEDGDRLTNDELLSQSIGLLIAGFETTIGLIGNGMRALIQHPDQLALLQAEPGRIDAAVEECLRYDGPIILTVRVLHDDAEIRGVKIARNERVFAMLASANRDPAVFEAPDRLDIGRDPNPHLAFGGGAHMCLGAHLARLEARRAIGGLVSRLSDLSLQSEKVDWSLSLFRVPARLPIGFRPR